MFCDCGAKQLFSDDQEQQGRASLQEVFSKISALTQLEIIPRRLRGNSRSEQPFCGKARVHYKKVETKGVEIMMKEPRVLFRITSLQGSRGTGEILCKNQAGIRQHKKERNTKKYQRMQKKQRHKTKSGPVHIFQYLESAHLAVARVVFFKKCLQCCEVDA